MSTALVGAEALACCAVALRKIVFWAALAIPLFGFERVHAQSAHVPTIISVCAQCHGADGATGDVETPVLAGQKGIYLRLQLLAFRSGKRNHPQMTTIGRNLNDREIDQVVLYYSMLPPP